MVFFLIVILLIFFIIILFFIKIKKIEHYDYKDFLFYYKYCFLPYKNVEKTPIKNIMIGLPTIDRDIDLAPKMYDALILSMKYIRFFYNINFDIFVITRKSDFKSIQFWKEKSKLVLVKNYKIERRHNFIGLTKTFNKLIKKSKKYDALFIVESDIIINQQTLKKLYEKLKTNHIVCSYYNIPWCGYPFFVRDGFFPCNDNADVNNSMRILGHGTGCILIRTEVFAHCDFTTKYFFKIQGQDIGFFLSAFKERYSTFLINDKVQHMYNRI